MTKSILVVFGATGLQGGSIIDFVLDSPNLSSRYTLRAVTRDETTEAAQQLRRKGVEIVIGDADKPDTLAPALSGAQTVFIISLTKYDDYLKEREFRQTKAMADASVKAGAQYIIYSTMVHAKGLYNEEVIAFDSKAEGELYIRSLPVKSAFFAPGMFMQNFLDKNAFESVPDKPGKFTFTNFIHGDTEIPFIDARADSGKFIGAILARPDQYDGQILCASTRMFTCNEIATIITRITGRETTYVRVSEEEWADSVAPEVSRPRVAMYKFIESRGYYGDNSKEKVAWTSEQVDVDLTSFEDFVLRNSLFSD